MTGRRNILAVCHTCQPLAHLLFAFSPWFAESYTVSLPQTVLSLVLMLLERCPVVVLARNSIAF